MLAAPAIIRPRNPLAHPVGVAPGFDPSHIAAGTTINASSVNLGGNPISIAGKFPQKGDSAPAFSLVGKDLADVTLASLGDEAMVEIERSKLDIANDYRYVSLVVAATGGTATICGGFFIGWRTRTLPPTYGADKAEIVIVDG